MLGVFIIFLGTPLVLGYLIGEKKNRMWRNLGLIMWLFGIAIMIVGA